MTERTTTLCLSQVQLELAWLFAFVIGPTKARQCGALMKEIQRFPAAAELIFASVLSISAKVSDNSVAAANKMHISDRLVGTPGRSPAQAWREPSKRVSDSEGWAIFVYTRLRHASIVSYRLHAREPRSGSGMKTENHQAMLLIVCIVLGIDDHCKGLPVPQLLFRT